MLHDPRRRRDQVLAVVEDEQAGAARQMIGDLVEHADRIGAHLRVAAAPLAAGEAENVADGGRDELGVTDRCELHQPYAVGVFVRTLGSGLEGQPGLARPAHPGERQQLAR